MDRSITGLAAFSQPPDSQRPSTKRNDGQRGQRDIGGVADLKEPVFIDMQLVRMCKDELDAINLCIDLSRLPDEVIAERLSIDKGHFSRMRKGRAHFPTAKRLALMALAGNWVPIQYELHRSQILERLKQQFAAPVRDDGFGSWMGAAA